MKNGLKTAVLLAALAGLILVLGSFWGRGGLVVAFVIALAMVGGSYWFSDTLAIKSARAVELQPGQLPEYHTIMTELTQLLDMPMPRLYVSPESQPNAFATGRNPDHAAVCVTEGLLRRLNWDEIRGVLAHELCHVRNRDVLIASVAATIATTIAFAANMMRFAAFFGGGSRDDDEGSNPLVMLAFALLAPLAAGVIQMAISRSREYEADRSAARLLGDGESLARALEKLHGYAGQIPSHVAPTQASQYIVNPLTNRRVSFANLFSTHPPAEDRIRILRSGEWREAF